MRAISFVSYFCGKMSRSRVDLDVANFVNAVKGDAGESLFHLDTKDGHEAAEWFGEIGALALTKKGLRLPIVLIPVPDSSCTWASDRMPRSALLACSLARHLTNAVVIDALRWRRKVKPSHEGGTRDPARLYANLTMLLTIPRGTSVVVDDVLTTGGHVRAAAARISTRSAHPCGHAICLARTVPNREDECFSIAEAEFPDFRPSGHERPWLPDCLHKAPS